MTDTDPTSAAQRPKDARPSRRLLEFFWMNRRLSEARDLAHYPTGLWFAECQLGFSALRDAHQLGNSKDGRDTALLLYRTAVRLLIRAELQRRDLVTSSDAWHDTWTKAQFLENVRISGPSEAVDAALASESGERFLSELAPKSREKMIVDLRRLAQNLADALDADASRVQRLLWTRRFRISAVALIAICAICWSLRKASGPPNLALHRPVVVSDRDPTYGVDPRQVVDGDELNLGFHTGNQLKATLTIDLGEVKPVARVAIFNRPDCCQERAVPLSVQLSTDGRNYSTIERRTRSFQEWQLSLPSGSRARFVRLRHEGYNPFHLAEVKVY